MITISGYNPSAASVAFGNKSGESKSLKTLKMTPVGESFEYIKPSQLVREKRGIGSLFRKGAMGLGVVLASFGLPGCGKDEMPTPKSDTFQTDYTEMMKNTYAMNEQEALAGKFDTIGLKSEYDDIVGLKSLGKQGDSTLVRVSQLDKKTGKVGGSVLYKFFKKAGAADGSFSAKAYLYKVIQNKGAVLQGSGTFDIANKNKMSIWSASGAEYFRSQAKEVGKLIEKTLIECGDTSNIKYTRIR